MIDVILVEECQDTSTCCQNWGLLIVSSCAIKNRPYSTQRRSLVVWLGLEECVASSFVQGDGLGIKGGENNGEIECGKKPHLCLDGK